MKRRALVVPPHPIDAHRDQAHHFDAAGDHDIVGARDDALCGEIQRLLGGAAFAIQRHGRDALGKAGRQDRLPADVS